MRTIALILAAAALLVALVAQLGAGVFFGAVFANRPLAQVLAGLCAFPLLAAMPSFAFFLALRWPRGSRRAWSFALSAAAIALGALLTPLLLGAAQATAR